MSLQFQIYLSAVVLLDLDFSREKKTFEKAILTDSSEASLRSPFLKSVSYLTSRLSSVQKLFKDFFWLRIKKNNLNNNLIPKMYQFRICFICFESQAAELRAITSQVVKAQNLILRSTQTKKCLLLEKTEVITVIECLHKNKIAVDKIVGRLSLEKGVSSINWSVEEIAI